MSIANIEKLEMRQLLAFAAHINFQPGGSTVPSGYIADSGKTYASRNGLTYGWDADNSANTRDRNSSLSPDQRYDTHILTQRNGNRKWEISVPNGSYTVRLVAGDPSYTDSVFRFNAEGSLALSGTPSSSTHWIEATETVSVKDGRLTITNGSGAKNNKLAFIDIDSATGSTLAIPPASPSNLNVSSVSSTSLKLAWSDNSVREDGYKIERSTDGKSFSQIATVGANVSTYTNTGLTSGKKYYYRVRAYNVYGNSSYTNVASATTGSSSSGTFSPKPLNWSSKASNPLHREESQSIVYNGKLYAIGGYVDDYDASLRVDAYDPNTNTWSRKHDMPSAFPDTHAAVVKDPNGHVFWFIGGFLGSFQHLSDGPHGPPATALVYKYDAATDTWSKGPSLPTERAAGGAGIVNNKIYYFGGADVTRNNDKSDTFMLDLNNQSAGWKKVATMPNARNHLGGIAANGFIYAIGGQHHVEDESVMQSEVDRFDPSTNTWTKVASLPHAESHFNAATVLYDRYIITVGGENPHNTAQPWVFAYDTMRNQWAQMTNLPEPRRAGAAGLIGTKLIFTSGYYRPEALTATTWSTDLAGVFS
jgi:N-acetylneuraminic acid mutarotase